MSLATTHSADMWSSWMKNGKKPDYRKTPQTAPNSDHQKVGHDTIGMLALDSNGNIACGTTTNGCSYKIPGRVGDNPIAGAGAYCETGVGGATATAGGVVFAGGTLDKLIRAFDSETGKELWSHKLPYIGSAPPTTYKANGEQYRIQNDYN